MGLIQSAEGLKKKGGGLQKRRESCLQAAFGLKTVTLMPVKIFSLTDCLPDSGLACPHKCISQSLKIKNKPLCHIHIYVLFVLFLWKTLPNTGRCSGDSEVALTPMRLPLILTESRTMRSHCWFAPASDSFPQPKA